MWSSNDLKEKQSQLSAFYISEHQGWRINTKIFSGSGPQGWGKVTEISK